jgi:hypothetical protein
MHWLPLSTSELENWRKDATVHLIEAFSLNPAGFVVVGRR